MALYNNSLSATQRSHLEAAIQTALECSGSHFRHGAVITSKSRRISAGRNDRSRVYLRGNFITSMHAEISAIHSARNTGLNIPAYRSACRKGYRNLELWTVRVSFRHGEITLLNSKPCSHCVHALKQAGIRKIWYSNEKGEIETSHIDDLTSKPTRYNRKVSLPLLKI